MLESYLNWDEQIKMVIDTWFNYSVKGVFNNIVVSGMGGSGIVGDILQLIASQRGFRIPIVVSKSHRLPGFVGEESLVIIASYSGNTIETILSFKEALDKRAKVVVLSSGGVLQEEAVKRNITYLPIPRGLLPRVSLPVMLYRLLALLDTSGLTIINREESIENYYFLREKKNEAFMKAHEIAEFIYQGLLEDRLLVISTHSPLEALAIRGKNEFNENSKIIVKTDIAPEWMHNDIVGYEATIPSKFSVLEIIDPGDKVGVSLVDFMRRILATLDTRTYRLQLDGRSIVEKIIYGSLVLGLSSVILANKRKIPPEETKSIAMYKKEADKIFSL